MWWMNDRTGCIDYEAAVIYCLMYILSYPCKVQKLQYTYEFVWDSNSQHIKIPLKRNNNYIFSNH